MRFEVSYVLDNDRDERYWLETDGEQIAEAYNSAAVALSNVYGNRYMITGMMIHFDPAFYGSDGEG